MGEFDADELIVLMLDGIDTVLCFDCDPESAATTPSIFWQWRAGELIDIGDSRFCVTADEQQIVEVGFVPAHERTRPHVLSSYTKLNRNLKDSVLLLNGIEQSICPSCHGDSVSWDNAWGINCEKCDGHGVVEVAIVVPAWVIGLGCENA